MAIPVIWEDYGPDDEFPDPPPEDQVPFEETNFAGLLLDTNVRSRAFRSTLALGYPMITEPNNMLRLTSVY